MTTEELEAKLQQIKDDLQAILGDLASKTPEERELFKETIAAMIANWDDDTRAAIGPVLDELLSV